MDSTVYPTTTLLGQQLAILTSLLLDSASSTSYSLLSRLLRSTPSPTPAPPSRSVVVVTGTGTGLARDLALRLAATGWHVFVQAPGQIELSGLVLSWQRLKSRLATGIKTGKGLGEEAEEGSTGSLIPLVFSSLDPVARAEAVSTVRAYVREHGMFQLHLVNTMDPSRARSSSSPSGHSPPQTGPSPSPEPDRPPTTPTTTTGLTGDRPVPHHRRHSTTTTTSSSSSGGPGSSSAFASPPSILATDSAWREVPLPLAISTDSYMVSLTQHSLVATVSLVQDFLPLLRSTSVKGRVVNVWAGAEGTAGWPGYGSGPVGVALDGFKSLTRCLGEELDGLGIKVSLVLPGSMSLVARSSASDLSSSTSTPPVASTKLVHSKKQDVVATKGPTKRRGSRGSFGGPTVLPTVSVTNDVRSILTVASDPSVRAHFDKLLKLHTSLATSLPPFSDPPLVFRAVRSSLTDAFPRPVYPVGLDAYVANWAEESVPANVRALVARTATRWWTGRRRK